MELSKGNFMRLVVVSATCAAVCLISIVLLGNSLREYWTFQDNYSVEQGKLSALRERIGESARALKVQTQTTEASLSLKGDQERRSALREELKELELSLKGKSDELKSVEENLRKRTPQEQALISRLKEKIGEYEHTTNLLQEANSGILDARQKASSIMQDAEKRAAMIIEDAKKAAQDMEKGAAADLFRRIRCCPRPCFPYQRIMI